MTTISFPNESNTDFERKYEDFVYIIKSDYQEYINLGWEKIDAADRIIDEVEPMMEDDFSGIIINIELWYLFANQDIEEMFIEVYEKLCKKYKKNNILEFPVLLKNTKST
ncbi:hypothetical protein, partial [Peribacillus frigoritolerans]|uniref:hypothetical protein n=1 Tax=Peribacillus frigoritolerans TaxID=450367 RepID=UPI001E3D9E17